MMAYERSESAWDNLRKFINQFQPETKTLIRKLERILNELYRQNLSLLFNEIHIYVYIGRMKVCCVLVCFVWFVGCCHWWLLVLVLSIWLLCCSSFPIQLVGFFVCEKLQENLRKERKRLRYLLNSDYIYFRVLMTILWWAEFSWTSRNMSHFLERCWNIFIIFSGGQFKAIGHVQWVFISRGHCWKRRNLHPSLRLDEHVHYLLTAKWKRVHSVLRWRLNREQFLFGASKSVFQACAVFVSYHRLLGTATLFNLFFLFFLLISKYVLLDASLPWDNG